MGAGVVLAILWRLRYVIATLAVVAAVWGAWTWFKGVLAERDELRTAVVRVEAVNRENSKAMRELQVDWQIERVLTEKAIKQSADRLAQSQQIIRELKNVPGYNDPAGPVWDAYSRRLRGAHGDRAPNH
jgi:hypothetical protein